MEKTLGENVAATRDYDAGRMVLDEPFKLLTYYQHYLISKLLRW